MKVRLFLKFQFYGLAYQIKCKLRHTKPAIFRTLLVGSNIIFYELHHILQIAMGWGNYHLFNFHYHYYYLELPNEEDEMYNEFLDLKKIDPRTITLVNFLFRLNLK